MALAARIRQELDDVERLVSRAERALIAARRNSEDQDLLVDSAALSLHDFYAGIERIFVQIATNVDDSLPVGPGWHHDLLDQMTQDLPGKRPPVLTSELAESLDEYLRFRHVVRHVYAFVFDADSIRRLVDQLGNTFERLREEFENFVRILEQVGE
jgi:hypothetical protein